MRAPKVEKRYYSVPTPAKRSDGTRPRPSEAKVPDPNPTRCNSDFITWILGPDGREWCNLTDGRSMRQTDGHIQDENIASLISFYLTTFLAEKPKAHNLQTKPPASNIETQRSHHRKQTNKTPSIESKKPNRRRDHIKATKSHFKTHAMFPVGG